MTPLLMIIIIILSVLVVYFYIMYDFNRDLNTVHSDLIYTYKQSLETKSKMIDELTTKIEENGYKVAEINKSDEYYVLINKGDKANNGHSWDCNFILYKYNRGILDPSLCDCSKKLTKKQINELKIM